MAQVDAACPAGLADAASRATLVAAVLAMVIPSAAPAPVADVVAAAFLAARVAVLVGSVGQAGLVSLASLVTLAFQRALVVAGAAAVSSLAIAH